MKRPTPLTVRAHAKVNLDLRVLGVRPDGYHELRTVFQTIELHDTLVCAERPGPFTLKCRTSGIPLDSENLIWKAAVVLWTAARTRGRRARHERDDRQADSRPGRSRRRERRCSRRACWPRSVVGRRAAEPLA